MTVKCQLVLEIELVLIENSACLDSFSWLVKQEQNIQNQAEDARIEIRLITQLRFRFYSLSRPHWSRIPSHHMRRILVGSSGASLRMIMDSGVRSELRTYIVLL